MRNVVDERLTTGSYKSETNSLGKYIIIVRKDNKFSSIVPVCDEFDNFITCGIRYRFKFAAVPCIYILLHWYFT